MEERKKARHEKDREKRSEPERVGGGPYTPGGDAELGNMPGEMRELGLEPPEPEPALPGDESEITGGILPVEGP